MSKKLLEIYSEGKLLITDKYFVYTMEVLQSLSLVIYRIAGAKPLAEEVIKSVIKTASEQVERLDEDSLKAEVDKYLKLIDESNPKAEKHHNPNE
ncbi:MAG: hypothetical protein F6K62_12235 [Sphaerospermopsis sp. SIO1G2]|nr:hypothetical protein [Sphaerospermopsis sp. SIO1G2]